MINKWFWHNPTMQKALVHVLMLISLLPLVLMVIGFQQWGLGNSTWVATLYMVMTFVWMVYFFGFWLTTSKNSIMTMLYLAFFISVATLLKTIPLPLGMTLAFLIPMLASVYIHPMWGVLIGLAAQGLSALLFGGLGPWTPMQMMLFAIFSGLLIWVPRLVRSNLLFVLVYLSVWGVFYGFAMSLYVWPVITPDTLTASWSSFWGVYVSTSLWWDLFRAGGNGLIWLLTYRSLRPYFLKVERLH